MNYQEAIEMMKKRKFGAAIRCHEETAQMCELAITALEKQIPKKPEAIYQKGTMWTGDCPLCNQKQSYGSIEWHRFFNKFCLKCGQALDWSDNDAEQK